MKIKDYCKIEIISAVVCPNTNILTDLSFCETCESYEGTSIYGYVGCSFELNNVSEELTSEQVRELQKWRSE